MWIKSIIFWSAFTIIGIWGQFLMPGVDFLTTGLVVLLQLGYLSSAFWFGLLWMLIQEGTGTLAFGAVMLYYAGLVLAFYFGAAFFEVRNLLFSAVFFMVLAAIKIGLIGIMISLQGVAPAEQASFEAFFFQFGVYFGLWLTTYSLCKNFLKHEPVKKKKPA